MIHLLDGPTSSITKESDVTYAVEISKKKEKTRKLQFRRRQLWTNVVNKSIS